MVDYAVFIVTNRRPNRVITYNTLRRQGYTGEIYIIVDSEDPTIGRYRELYANKVIVFDKSDFSDVTDICDNFPNQFASVVYARNACFAIAKQLGIQYFLVLDDDYKEFQFRLNSKMEYSFRVAKRLDDIFNYIFEYYKSIPALTIAIGQTGELIGGAGNMRLESLRFIRKAMNAFFCCADRPFSFIGRLNEDVTTYTVLGSRGNLIFTIFNLVLGQLPTQSNPGGTTELYINMGTYTKSFYTVMNAPSCVVVCPLNSSDPRLHHRVNWGNAVPVIISEDYCKNPKRLRGVSGAGES